LTGIIHCIWRFAEEKEPCTFLRVEDLDRGIQATEFYLGQALDAMRLIRNPKHLPQDLSSRTLHLAKALESLRGEVDNGRLAVGFILERFNSDLPAEQKIGQPRALGAMLRSLGLTMAAGKHDANGKRAVSCLAWDAKIESFIKTHLQRLQCLQTKPAGGSVDADVQSAMSATSEMSANGFLPKKNHSSGVAALTPSATRPEPQKEEAPSSTASGSNGPTLTFRLLPRLPQWVLPTISPEEEKSKNEILPAELRELLLRSLDGGVPKMGDTFSEHSMMN